MLKRQVPNTNTEDIVVEAVTFCSTLKLKGQESTISLGYQNMDSIVITKADKQNTMVVVDRDDYDGKIRTLLADELPNVRKPEIPSSNSPSSAT